MLQYKSSIVHVYLTRCSIVDLYLIALTATSSVDPYLSRLGGNMAESVGKRRSARTRLPSLKAGLNDSSLSKVTSTPLSSRAKRYQKEKSIMHFN